MEPRISIITLGVSDMQRAYRFYHEGLGFPTAQDAEAPIIFFHTAGTRLALYPLPALAEDISDQLPPGRGEFPGLTLAHNTRTQAEVDEILRRAEEAGGKIEKPAQPTSWGGYSGYFSDPDGYLWEVAYADAWTFNPDGSLALEGLSSAREAWYIVNVEAVVHRKDRYLMVVRGAGESHAPGLLSLVGGKVEAAGDAQQILEATLRREIREETGIEVHDDLEYLSSSAFVADDGEPVIDVVFLCQYKGGKAEIHDPDEIAAIRWLTAAEILTDPDAPPWTRRSIQQAEERRRRRAGRAPTTAPPPEEETPWQK